MCHTVYHFAPTVLLAVGHWSSLRHLASVHNQYWILTETCPVSWRSCSSGTVGPTLSQHVIDGVDVGVAQPIALDLGLSWVGEPTSSPAPTLQGLLFCFAQVRGWASSPACHSYARDGQSSSLRKGIEFVLMTYMIVNIVGNVSWRASQIIDWCLLLSRRVKWFERTN